MKNSNSIWVLYLGKHENISYVRPQEIYNGIIIEVTPLNGTLLHFTGIAYSKFVMIAGLEH